MTTFALVAAKLWPHLRKLIIRIGRWVIQRLRKWGAQSLAIYMRIRVEVFEGRLGRARAKWRKKWLHGRIRRWLKVADWLEHNAKKVNTKVADKLEVLAIADRIPVNSPWERKAA